MPVNHLEQLVAEWYEYKGYFIRRNVKVGKIPRGGYQGELDIVGFHPVTRNLVHIETSLDTSSWASREAKYAKKFALGVAHTPTLFAGLNAPEQVEQIAIFAFASKSSHPMLGLGRVMLVSDLLQEIFSELRSKSILTSMIGEDKPILRTLQFVAEYRNSICKVLSG